MDLFLAWELFSSAGGSGSGLGFGEGEKNSLMPENFLENRPFDEEVFVSWDITNAVSVRDAMTDIPTKLILRANLFITRPILLKKDM